MEEELRLRPSPIAGAKTHNISPGLSLFDGKMRMPLFLRFMKERALTEEAHPDILALLIQHTSTFLPIAAIVSLPSKTWKAQNSYAKALSTHFNVPILPLLTWETPPEKRQGELLNNDQRHHNVHQKMKASFTSMPPGALILLDDYIGSGATLKEAARALRKTHSCPLIPLTIAAVKWRLGQPGFI